MIAPTSQPAHRAADVARPTHSAEASRASIAGLRKSPWVYGLSTAVTFFSLAAICLWASHRVSHEVLKQTLDEEMKTIAKIAAMSLDGDAHARLQHAEQLNGPEYLLTVQPLRHLQQATKRIKYLYTVRMSDEGPRFVIDAARPEDADGDGVLDQAPLTELYEEPDPSMLAACEHRASRVSAAPYTDKWGTFMSAFAPVYRKDGEFEALVGVDMTADEYLARLARMDQALFSGVAVAGAASTGLGIVVIIMVGRRQRMERMLLVARKAAEDASQSKSAFLANMSHEIRTPMTAILGLADLLHEPEYQNDRDKSREALATIKNNGQVLLTIINDILDLSKIEEGKMTVEQVPVSPATILREVAGLLELRAKEKGITIALSIAEDVPEWIISDPVRLRQVIINLLSNAIKFTQVGGVCLSLHRADDGNQPKLACAVADTGIGMTPEQCGRLFQAFEQADASTTRKFGGTGLGLRISRSLARILGGDVTVTSQLGKGSTFTATFAAQPATAATRQRDAETPSASPSPSAAIRLDGLRILVAEDGPENRRLIGHYLRKAGAIVDFAENGHEAIAKLCRDGEYDAELSAPPAFELLILDMQMPVMDGYAAAAELRARGSTLPIVALTAHAMSGEMEKCLSAGCTTYATKPIDKAQLIASCKRHAIERHAAADITKHAA